MISQKAEKTSDKGNRSSYLAVENITIPIEINKRYTLNQLTDLKKALQIKQGLTFNYFSYSSQLQIRCPGQVNRQHIKQEKCMNRDYPLEITYNQIKKQRNACTYKLSFIIEQSTIDYQNYNEFLNNSDFDTKFNYFSSKTYKLTSFCLEHSINCVVKSDKQFTFQRNYRYLDDNKQLFMRLILNKYLLNKQKPEKAKDYLLFLEQIHGFQFLYQGIINSKDRMQLKRKFDNILGKARKQFSIPSTQVMKKPKKRKDSSDYQIPSQEIQYCNDQKQTIQTRSLRKKYH